MVYAIEDAVRKPPRSVRSQTRVHRCIVDPCRLDLHLTLMTEKQAAGSPGDRTIPRYAIRDVPDVPHAGATAGILGTTRTRGPVWYDATADQT